MSAWSERLLRRFYANRPHPSQVFDRRVDGRVSSARVDALLDAGCGRSAPVLRKYVGRVRRLVCVELEEFADVPPEVEVYNADLARLPLADGVIDLVISRSVFEHLANRPRCTGSLRES